jgi:hypothetical protein
MLATGVGQLQENRVRLGLEGLGFDKILGDLNIRQKFCIFAKAKTI